MRTLELDVLPDEDGVTVSDFLRGRGFSRRIITALKASGGITRGGAVLRTVDRVFSGETVRILLTEEVGTAVPNPGIAAKTVFEDGDVVVFDKPPGVPTHPSHGHYGDTLANLFAAIYPDTAFRPLNRLDRDTSGLCVCAKNALAASLLQNGIEKVYYAAVDGDIRRPGGICAPIGRVSDSVIKREVRDDGQTAQTLFGPVLWGNGRTLLRVTILTGRTHQIRVHMAHMGYPLCGDGMYGGDCSAINRQALHCGEVSFTSPISGERILAKCPIPDDIAGLFESNL